MRVEPPDYDAMGRRLVAAVADAIGPETYGQGDLHPDRELLPFLIDGKPVWGVPVEAPKPVEVPENTALYSDESATFAARRTITPAMMAKAVDNLNACILATNRKRGHP